MKENNEQKHEVHAEANQTVDPRIKLAIEATELALERTQLAWVRTVLGLIGGGFAIDKGWEILHNTRIASGEAWVNNAHALGMVLTGTGTALMVLVTILYIRRLRELRLMECARKSIIAPVHILSAIVIVTGILLIYVMGFS